MENPQSVLSSNKRNRRDLTGEARFDGLAHQSDLGRGSSDQRIGIAPEGPDYSAELRPAEPSIHGSRSPRRSGLKNDRLASNRAASLGGRVFRGLARFFIAALIGVGVTLAWQSHGDEAKEMVRTRAPSLGWLLPVSNTKPEGQALPAAAVTSPELAQQLKPMALDLAVVRRSAERLAAQQEQLAAQQEQMAQSLTTLQAVEQDIRQKMSSQPPSRAVPVAARKPPQSAAQSSAVQSASVPAPPPAQQPLR